MKLAVVGGGSTYTPELLDGLAAMGDRPLFEELVLHDIDAGRLAVVGGFAQRILRSSGSSARLTLTTDLEAAVDGATAVLLQLRVGGQAARASDESFPLACDCLGQETTGAGGLAKALRTVPVVRGIAEVVRARALPDAWIVDFTNPVGIVTRALLEDGHRAVGLCNVAIGFQRMFAGWLGCAPDRVALDHIGLNHLTWIRSVTLDGQERMPEILAQHGAELAENLEMPRALVEAVGAIPSYYLRYYYQHDEVVRELKSSGTRAAEVMAIEAELLEMYADPALTEKPALLEQRGGAYYSQAAVALVESLLGQPGAHPRHVVNVRNGSTMPFLPAGAVIEVPADVDADGIHVLPVAEVAADLRGLISHVSAYEELALDAAVRGGRDRVLAALLAHPLVGQYDLAERLTDDLLAANHAHLPWISG
jgi:6-phospho-beta-glucosidase